MSLSCVLCQENWCFISPLCEECKKIRQLGNLYGMTKIKNILTRVLLREDKAIDGRTESSKKIQENVSEIKNTMKVIHEDKNIEPPVTRNQGKNKK
jgi:hypothetical protein